MKRKPIRTEPQVQPFDLAAISMLEYAGLKPVLSDVKLLADDLQGVADEFSHDTESEHAANHAVHVLRKRIGGYSNLESYLRCLRVPSKAVQS